MDGVALIGLLSRFRENVEGVLLGKREAVDLALASFLAGGHILLEDVPGTGKTTLARALRIPKGKELVERVSKEADALLKK